jgi:hypothetical protein
MRVRAPALAGALYVLNCLPATAQFQVAVPPQVPADTVVRTSYLKMLRKTLDQVIADTLSLDKRQTADTVQRYCEARWVHFANTDSLLGTIGISQLDRADIDRPTKTIDRSRSIDLILADTSGRGTAADTSRHFKVKQLHLYSCDDDTQVYLEDGQLRIATKEGAIISHRADGGFNRRHWVHTLPKSYERVAALYNAKGVGFLTGATAGISDDQAFLSTVLVSGVTWRLHFSASIMESKATAKSPDSTVLSDELFQDRQNAVQRIVFNGGSATARFLIPFGAEGGRNAQRSGGVYLQLGAVGDLTDQKDLRGTVGLVAEHMLSLAIRKPSDHSVAASFLLGLRGGYHWVPESTGILRGVTDKNHSIPFGQLLLGLRQSERLDYALIYTFSDARFNPYLSEVQFRIKASAGAD